MITGQSKLIDYRIPVLTIRQWLKELESPSVLSVVELYCSTFGSCNVILPTINNIMVNIDNSSEKLKWLTVNIQKLEDEQKLLLLEENKKRNPQLQQNNTIHNDNVTPNFNTTPNNEYMTLNTISVNDPDVSIHKSDELHVGVVNQSTAVIQATWDKIYIPKLEKYTRYDAPQPLWLFIRDGTILYSLNSPNPPKMNKIIYNILHNIQLNDHELSTYDFITATQDELNQRKARKLKHEAEKRAHALEQAKHASKQTQINKPVRTHDINEYYIEPVISCNTLTHTFIHNAVCVLYTKEADSIDFVYYNQTELLPSHKLQSSQQLQWNKLFSYTQSIQQQNNDDNQPSDDNNNKNEIEFKFAIYDTVDEIIKTKDIIYSDQCQLIGDAYVHYQQLFNTTNTEDDTNVDSIPAVELKLMSNRHTAHSTDHNDACVGVLHASVKQAVSEGTVSTYNVLASVTVTQQPNESNDNDVATATPLNDTIQLKIASHDRNTGAVYSHYIDTQLNKNDNSMYSNNTPLQIETYEFVPRMFEISVVDIASNTVLCHVEISSVDLLKQSQLTRTVDFPLNEYLIQLQVYPYGSEADEYAAELPSEQKLTLQYSLNSLVCPLQSQHHNAQGLIDTHNNHGIIVALSQQDTHTTQYKLHSITELATESTHHIFTSNDKITLNTVSTVQKPVGDELIQYKISVYMLQSVQQPTTSALQYFIEHNKVYTVLSSVFTLSADLLNLSMNHIFPCIDSCGQPVDNSSIECNVIDIGSIQPFNVNFDAILDTPYTLTLYSRVITNSSDAVQHEYKHVATLSEQHNYVVNKMSNVKTQYKLEFTQPIAVSENTVTTDTAISSEPTITPTVSTEFNLIDLLQSISTSDNKTIHLTLSNNVSENQTIIVSLLPLPAIAVDEPYVEVVADENIQPNLLQVPDVNENNAKTSSRSTGSRPVSHSSKSARSSGRLAVRDITPTASKPSSRSNTPSRLSANNSAGDRRKSSRSAA